MNEALAMHGDTERVFGGIVAVPQSLFAFLLFSRVSHAIR